ncbi:MAG TPA: hypothetical protein DCY10_04185, partial [Clostridiales bacterium]|nr:hypothetical protein [Clostridiales bacterium]
ITSFHHEYSISIKKVQHRAHNALHGQCKLIITCVHYTSHHAYAQGASCSLAARNGSILAICARFYMRFLPDLKNSEKIWLSLMQDSVYNSTELDERSVIGRWNPFPNEVKIESLLKRAFGKHRLLAARGKAKGVTLP